MPFDTPVIQRLEALAACLCNQIVEDGLPEVCFCGLVAGEAPAIEHVNSCKNKCGMAWVRLTALAPISGVGIVNDTLNNCNSEIGYDAEVGIMRCMPVGRDGKPPTEAQVLEATQLQIADATTMVKAVQCCEALGDFKLEAYTPAGPEGGAVGGFWTLTAGV